MIKKKIILLIAFFIKRVWFVYWKFIARKYKISRDKTNRKPRLMFGTTPIINNKYWANALKLIGFDSTSVVYDYYSINKKSDYDLYFKDIFEKQRSYLKHFAYEYVVFDFILKNYDIIHMPFDGLEFKDFQLKENEIRLLKKFGCKIVVLPYGADFWQYSLITDVSWKHVLQCNYPAASNKEEQINKNIKKLTKEADIIIPGFQTDGIGRWDVFPYNIVCIDVNQCVFNPKRYNNNDGINGTVKIVHTPNHRSIKGSEFIVNAVNELRREGLKIELILLEKRANEEVLTILGTEADILVEQLVLGYALSAMEGMASGLPVLSNLSFENYTRAFRRYSYLNECPILSVTPESIKENLKLLVLNPSLRKELGLASRAYVQKYHSNETIQHVFKNIYDKIWFHKEVDLMNMFHPMLKESYNNMTPIINHVLVENKLPETLLNNLKMKF